MISVVAYPKSGSHLCRALLRSAGLETTHTHTADPSRDARCSAPDLHVARDVRGLVVSAVCHFVLGGPETDPERIRPHVLDVADRMRSDWQQRGARSWSDYVESLTERSRHSVTFSQLVERPREALLPVADVGPARARVAADVASDMGRRWAKHKLRVGRPGSWAEVLTASQERQILAWHRAGQEIVEAIEGGDL